jgi:valyl-tRNA synthetase
MNVPPGAKIGLLLKDASDAAQQRVERQREIVEPLARLTRIDFIDGEVPGGSVQIVLDEATAVLPLGDVIDVAQERARLAREVEKVQAEIAKLDKKLSNEQFLAKAPPEVVADQRERREEATATEAKIAAALAQIAGTSSPAAK